MLPGIYDVIKRLSNNSLYYLVCDVQERQEKSKWPTNSQAEYYIDDFVQKFNLSRPETESMVMDAVMKVSFKRFRKLFEDIKDIGYEMQPGAHTVHQCDCNRRSARRSRCVLCIVDSNSE